MYKAGGVLPLHIKKVKVKPPSIKSIAFLSAKKKVLCNWEDDSIVKKRANEECMIGSHAGDGKQ